MSSSGGLRRRGISRDTNDRAAPAGARRPIPSSGRAPVATTGRPAASAIRSPQSPSTPHTRRGNVAVRRASAMTGDSALGADATRSGLRENPVSTHLASTNTNSGEKSKLSEDGGENPKMAGRQGDARRALRILSDFCSRLPTPSRAASCAESGSSDSFRALRPFSDLASLVTPAMTLDLIHSVAAAVA